MDTSEVGHQLYAALDAQDWPRIEALAWPDLVVQVDSFPPMGFDQWRRGQEAFYVGFPDGHHVIDEFLVDGDRFVTRCRFEGTHRGQFAEIAATGATVSVGVIHIDRFQGGRLAEHRGQLDMLGLLRQIGVTP